MVVGPPRSGKSSFIKTFINYKFSFQKIKQAKQQNVYCARKIIKDVEFEVEFIDPRIHSIDKENWADTVLEEIEKRF